jgi:TolB-like protein/Flp pilus assembly protein TadD
MSGDPEQQYFSDGITEDIITELARFRQLDVVARNSSFQYRDKAVDVKRVGRELGARYVVEGSVRKAGPRVRITAQLIDAETGNHLWAERYDRELQDIFAIQDEVVTTVVARLAGAVQSADFEAARRKRTENLGAYDCYLRGMEIFYRTAGSDLERACELFQRAISLDPDFALAYAHLAIALIFDYWASAHRSPAEGATMLDRALEAASAAVALDDSDATCHRALAHVHISRRAFDLAEHHLNMASELNPNDSELLSYRAWLEVCAGRPDSALAWLDRGQRLSSRQQFWQWELRGMALYQLHRYADAIAAFERMPTGPAWCERYRAACYAQLGRLDEARAKAAEAMRRDPGFTLRRYAEVEPYQSRASLEHMIEGMRKAGLPE